MTRILTFIFLFYYSNLAITIFIPSPHTQPHFGSFLTIKFTFPIGHEVRLSAWLSLTSIIQSWVAIHGLSFFHLTQSVKTIQLAQSSLNTCSHTSSFPHLCSPFCETQYIIIQYNLTQLHHDKQSYENYTHSHQFKSSHSHS